jgi:hypothetical protein
MVLFLLSSKGVLQQVSQGVILRGDPFVSRGCRKSRRHGRIKIMFTPQSTFSSGTGVSTFTLPGEVVAPGGAVLDLVPARYRRGFP